MAYDSLADFVKALEGAGELKRVGVPVSPELEITEIADRTVKSGGPALLFEDVRGPGGEPYSMPLLINAFASARRMAMALGVGDVEELAGELSRLLRLEVPQGLLAKVKMLPRLARLASFAPRVVKEGPCQEVIEEREPSFEILPALKCWPGDGGRFITMPQVYTKHPVTGQRNAGMYRMQIYDERTAGLHMHLHHDGALHARAHAERGERMEAAVAIGGDPALSYAATAPLPYGIDELNLAGFLRRKRVELVRCRKVGLEVPACADIVLEGYVEPGERRLEGPFGDHTGFYSPADDYPVFHLECVTRRTSPIYLATIVGRPPMEDYYLGKVTERLFLPLIRLQLPEVVDVNMPAEGVFHNLLIVSVRKEYPHHAKKVMYALWGMGQMMLTKVILVVDAEVNVHDLSEVAWRALANIDPRRDIFFLEGPADALEHASERPHVGTKMGIDATRKSPAEGGREPWPDAIEMSPEVKELVKRRWEEYGLG